MDGLAQGHRQLTGHRDEGKRSLCSHPPPGLGEWHGLAYPSSPRTPDHVFIRISKLPVLTTLCEVMAVFQAEVALNCV